MIKQISLLDLLDRYGIKVDRNNFFKVRDEKTSSARFYAETNSWYDFGANVGGDIIDLVKFVEQVNTKQAIQIISTHFALPTQTLENGKKYLSNNQYKRIGLYGDRASKNYDFRENGQDLFSIYTKEQMLRISQKLSIPMNQLFMEYPKTYAKVIRTRAIPFVHGEYQAYLHSLYTYSQYMNSDNKFDKDFTRICAKESFADYQERIEILDKAIYGTDITGLQHPNFERDLEQIQKGLIAVEISEYPYRDLLTLPGANVRIALDIDTYNQLRGKIDTEHMECPYSALVKGDVVTLVIKEPDCNAFKSLFKELGIKKQYSQKTVSTVAEMKID